MHSVDLAKRLGLSPESVGTQLSGGRFLGLEARQMTVLVDDIDIDPSAFDLLSYTFWCEVSGISNSVTTQDIIQVDVNPVDILAEEGRWVADKLVPL